MGSGQWQVLGPIVMNLPVHEWLGISGPAERLSASQEGLYCMQLFTLI